MLKMNLKFPIIVVNFKTYKESSGANAVKLAKLCEEIGRKHSVEIIPAVQVADIYRLKGLKLKVFGQHIDPVGQGQYTGFVNAYSAKEAGASGTLLNHCEHKLDLSTLKKSIEMSKSAGLITLVCASNSRKAAEAAKLNPDLIAVEPPELVGGNVSVSTAKPEIITDTIRQVKKISNIPVLCGAGIKNKEDVKKAIKLGSKGILVASGVVKAKDQRAALIDLIAGLK